MPELRRLLLLTLLLISPTLARPSLDLETLRQMASSSKLEEADSYLQSLQRGLPPLQKQGRWVRIPGEVPSLILPDLHAQRDYLLQALELKVEGKTVWQRLQSGQLNLVLLGDAMHSENRAQQRWLQAEAELSSAPPQASKAMQAEMVESLGLMRMIFELKAACPEHFFFLRGNHEDIDPARPYRKFTNVGESNLVRRWVLARFGQTFLKRWAEGEQALPLVAESGSFVASHSPPEAPLSRQQVVQGDSSAFRACTWSDNTRWTPGSAEERHFLDNCKLLGATPQRPWIVGHRKVVGELYRSQCGGRLLQINPVDSEPRVYLWAPAKGQPLQPQKAVRRL